MHQTGTTPFFHQKNPPRIIRTLVDANLGVFHTVVSKDDQDSVATLLSLDQDHISTEELKLLHGGGRQGQDRVVVVGGIVNNQLVRGSLLAKNGSGGVVLWVGIGGNNGGVLTMKKGSAVDRGRKSMSMVPCFARSKGACIVHASMRSTYTSLPLAFPLSAMIVCYVVGEKGLWCWNRGERKKNRKKGLKRKRNGGARRRMEMRCEFKRNSEKKQT
jgi:hypothetical protein